MDVLAQTEVEELDLPEDEDSEVDVPERISIEDEDAEELEK